ncbi:glycosyltransferase [Candidatus Phaeomarinobacter ectocarpi]|nr:glycosyltransferase [Candidatus Phaeomarinobacter ectocarpi]
MKKVPGGQQICTREYIEAITHAGFNLAYSTFEPANSLTAKITRRIDRQPYRYFVPKNTAAEVIRLCNQNDTRTVFLNVADLAPIAEDLKQHDPNLEIIMLSHGLGSVDYLHEIRTQNWGSHFTGLRTSQVHFLGQQIVEECRQRRWIDAVICLAPFEAEIERWLGVKRILQISRTVVRDELDWQPLDGQIGFVGRLDHPPNLEGLRLVLQEMTKRNASDIDVRIIGLPGDVGDKLAKQFPFATYLGSLPDEALREEAASWTCSINPLFCYARGASTKLAVMLGWGVPVLTTPEGMRGYSWPGGPPATADTPGAFADAALAIARQPAVREKAHAKTLMALATPYTIDMAAQAISEFMSVKQAEPAHIGKR